MSAIARSKHARPPSFSITLVGATEQSAAGMWEHTEAGTYRRSRRTAIAQRRELTAFIRDGRQQESVFAGARASSGKCFR